MPLPGIMGRMRGGALPPPEYEFVNSYVSTSNTSSYNFGSVPIGAEDPKRSIAVTVHSATSAFASSVTINGYSATLLERQQGSSRRSEIWAANVPLGTSVLINVSFPSSQDRCTIGVYRIMYLKSLTPEDTAVGQGNNTSNDISLSGVSPMAIIIACGTGDSSPSFSYSGVTEDYEGGWSDTSGSNQRFAGGSTQTLAGGTVSITQFSSGGSGMSAVSVALR